MLDAPRGFFRAEDVLNAARGNWVHVLGMCEVATELLSKRHGPCPGCGGNDRFRFDDIDGNGTFICSQGGGGNLSGNGLTLLQHVHGWDWKRSLEEVGKRLLRDEDRVGWNMKTGAAVPAHELRDADLPPEPKAPAVEIPKYNEEMLRDYVRTVPSVTREDLKRVSPMPVEGGSPGDFFEALYDDQERVLVFTNFFSQGDFGYQVGVGSKRLSPDRGVDAVESRLPSTGRNGVWFLCNPVDGKWQIEPEKRQFDRPPIGQEGPANLSIEPPKWGRRSWRNVTQYRYAVLESDSAPEDLWLKALVKLPVPIAAIYSSGGKSLHALIRIDADSKNMWDLMMRGTDTKPRNRQPSLMSIVCPLGADPVAISAIRLTRLPFCFREGTTNKQKQYLRYDKPRLQELVYLNPLPFDSKAPWTSIEHRHGSGRR